MAVISFTGNTETGRRIAGRAARRLKRLSMELGGKNGIVVLADADLDLATDGIVWSAYGTTGQRCTAASRVIVDRAVVDPLLQRLESRARALRLGDGLAADDRRRAARQRAGPRRRSRATWMSAGARASSSSAASRATGADLEHGHFFEPTIFAGVRPMDRLAQEEIFGPVLSVIAGRRLPGGGHRPQPDPLRPLVEHLHPRRERGVPGDARLRDRHRLRQRRARPAPRRICRSAASRTPATATARPATPRSTRTRSGSRSTSTSRAAPARPDRQPAGTDRTMPTFEDVRRIALALPEAEEILTWETDITFRVRGKIFAIGGEGATRVSIKARPDRQSELIDLDPETFASSAYVGPVRLDDRGPRAGRSGAPRVAASRCLAAHRPEAAPRRRWNLTPDRDVSDARLRAPPPRRRVNSRSLDSPGPRSRNTTPHVVRSPAEPRPSPSPPGSPRPSGSRCGAPAIAGR